MPAPALMLIPVTLVLVLVISAIAKVRAPDSTGSAVRLLRLPEWLSPTWVSKALPPGEFLLALAVLSPWLPLARLAAVAALALFAAYLLIIARAMTFKPRPSCGCFGNIGDQRVTWKTVIRNVLLVAGAAVFVWMTWSQASTVWSVFDTVSDREGWILASTAYLALMLWFIVAPPNYGAPWWRRLFPQQPAEPRHDHPAAEPEEVDEADYIRKPIPDAFLLDPEHDPVTLRDMTATEPVLLVFVNCSCGSTRQSWERLVGWDERLPGVRVLGVQTGQFGDFGIEGVAERLFYDPRSKAWQALGIGGTSAAVLLGADGLLAGGPVHGNDEVEQFVDDIAELLATAPATSDDTDTTTDADAGTTTEDTGESADLDVSEPAP